MHHQYGISEVLAQKSFHRETSGGVIKCQLFSLALLYLVQKKFTSCKWMAGFWVMPPPNTSPDKFSNTARSMHLLLTGFRRSKMPRFPVMSIIVLEVVYNYIRRRGIIECKSPFLFLFSSHGNNLRLAIFQFLLTKMREIACC